MVENSYEYFRKFVISKVIMELLTLLLLAFRASGINAVPITLTNTDEVRTGEFPYLISLLFDGNHVCGGSLISLRHSLTAAHCVYKFYENNIGADRVKIAVGTTKLSGGTIMELDRIKFHEDYVHFDTNPTFYADVAVMRTKLPIQISKDVNFIDLPVPFWEIPHGRKLVVAGFGAEVLNGPPSSILKKMTVYAVGKEICQHWWQSTPLASSLFCTNYAPKFGVCQGDSGGPVILGNSILIGVVSAVHSQGCGSGIPDLMTKVTYFMDFILEEMSLE